MARKSVLYLLAVVLKHGRIKEFCYDNESNEGYVCTSNADTSVKQHYFVPFTCNDSYDELDMMSIGRTKVFTFKKTTTVDEFTKLLVANKKHISVTEEGLVEHKVSGAGYTPSMVGAATIKTAAKVLGIPVGPGSFAPDDEEETDGEDLPEDDEYDEPVVRNSRAAVPKYR